MSGKGNATRRESLGMLQQVDALCDRFEAEWLAGSTPDIQQFLAECPADAQEKLAQELLAIELGYRRDDQGAPCTPQALAGLHSSLPREAVDAFLEAAAPDKADGPSNRDPFYTQPTGHYSHEKPSGLNIRCPHCQNAVELLEDSPLEEITCRTCGSNFSLLSENAPAENGETQTTRRRISRFELLKQLGMGGFGTVWKARDTDLDRCIALKIPRRNQLSRNEAELFLREARAAARLRHPNIVPVHEVGRDGDTIFIVSDLIRGVPLSEWLKQRKPAFRETAQILVKVADALTAAHAEGVIHRDLKPSNVMIDEQDVPHLMDFGLAKRQFGEVTMTMDGQVLGTPAYMSPEQAAGESRWIDRRTDIYSFGAMMFQMLTGELPFRGSLHSQIQQRQEQDAPSPRELNGYVPQDLATICVKCLERDPNRRYSTAKEVAEELTRYLRGEPIHARPISRMQRAARWAMRNPTLAGLAATVCLLAIAGPTTAAVMYWQRQTILAERAENTELNIRRLREQDTSSATIRSLDAQRARLTGANPAAAALPSDWREYLADDFLKRHYDKAVENLAAMPEDSPERAEANAGLAQLLRYTGKNQQAAQHLRQAVASYDRIANPDAQSVASTLQQLADVLTAMGEYEEAAELTERALALRSQLAGQQQAALDDRISHMRSLLDHIRHQSTRLVDAPPEAARPESLELLKQFKQSHEQIRKAWLPDAESIASLADALTSGDPGGLEPPQGGSRE